MRFELLSVSQLAAAAMLALSLFLVGGEAPIGVAAGGSLRDTDNRAVCDCLAITIQAWAQQFTTSTRTALIYMLEPVFAWVTSYVLAGEGLSGRAAAGAALILGGVVLVEMKLLNPRLHPSN